MVCPCNGKLYYGRESMVTARSPEGVRLSGDLFLEFWRVV